MRISRGKYCFCSDVAFNCVIDSSSKTMHIIYAGRQTFRLIDQKASKTPTVYSQLHFCGGGSIISKEKGEH